jgi:hypothetical protein
MKRLLKLATLIFLACAPMTHTIYHRAIVYRHKEDKNRFILAFQDVHIDATSGAITRAQKEAFIKQACARKAFVIMEDPYDPALGLGIDAPEPASIQSQKQEVDAYIQLQHGQAEEMPVSAKRGSLSPMIGLAQACRAKDIKMHNAECRTIQMAAELDPNITLKQVFESEEKLINASTRKKKDGSPVYDKEVVDAYNTRIDQLRLTLNAKSINLDQSLEKISVQLGQDATTFNNDFKNHNHEIFNALLLHALETHADTSCICLCVGGNHSLDIHKNVLENYENMNYELTRHFGLNLGGNYGESDRDGKPCFTVSVVDINTVFECIEKVQQLDKQQAARKPLTPAFDVRKIDNAAKVRELARAKQKEHVSSSRPEIKAAAAQVASAPTADASATLVAGVAAGAAYAACSYLRKSAQEQQCNKRSYTYYIQRGLQGISVASGIAGAVYAYKRKPQNTLKALGVSATALLASLWLGE